MKAILVLLLRGVCSTGVTSLQRVLILSLSIKFLLRLWKRITEHSNLNTHCEWECKTDIVIRKALSLIFPWSVSRDLGVDSISAVIHSLWNILHSYLGGKTFKPKPLSTRRWHRSCNFRLLRDAFFLIGSWFVAKTFCRRFDTGKCSFQPYLVRLEWTSTTAVSMHQSKILWNSKVREKKKV